MPERSAEFEELFQNLRLISRYTKHTLRQIDGQLTMTDFIFLKHLEGEGGVPVTDLARHFGVSASYITNWADRLEKKGLIRRERQPSDRRVVLLMMTEEGEAVRKSVEEKRMSHVLELLAEIEDEELVTLNRILRKILNQLEEKVEREQ
ncbi:MAG: Transcriptional regulator, MarR family [Candidatus Carbobacillus altaicus]|uniref:Transcriptional regulator, MarR family n=1 Tax=Candidatus Carbonibacillus altaicus TaxID=2163959 RepID=A0A2R6Y2Y9_9BACL|nr:MAG: Transcriptional regulator, MarR family [Candidatus Carbobacillus altaicus]